MCRVSFFQSACLNVVHFAGGYKGASDTRTRSCRTALVGLDLVLYDLRLSSASIWFRARWAPDIRLRVGLVAATKRNSG